MAAANIRPVWYINKNKDVPLNTYLVRQEPGNRETVVIFINFMSFMKYTDETVPSDDRASWVAVISHELQHVLEQYINNSHNPLVVKPNSLESFFRTDVNIDKDASKAYYSYTYVVIECFAPEEQRARSTQTDILLKQFLKDSTYRYQLLVMYSKEFKQQKELGVSSKTPEETMTAVLLSHELLQYVHRLKMYHSAIFEIASPDKEDDEDCNIAVMLTGYYLR